MKIGNFHCGDIVDFILPGTKLKSKAQRKRNALHSITPYKLIVLRPLENTDYLVAICENTARKTQLIVKTDSEPLYVKTTDLYIIDEECLHPCSSISPFENPAEVVSKICTLHNEYTEAVKKKKLYEKRKMKNEQERQRKIDKKHQKKHKKDKLGTMSPAERQLFKQEKKIRKLRQKQHQEVLSNQYEIAVMNNDHKRMKELENSGYNGTKARYRTRNGKVLYTNFNPHPSAGGSFTPK